MQKVGVVGAGQMGSEIALVFAIAGFEVVLTDHSQAALPAAIGRLEATLRKGISRGLYKPGDEAAMRRIAPTPALDSFADCALVTEAVFEQQDVKFEVLARLDRVCDAACVLATNTSTIPITVLASSVSPRRRKRFIGTHYFSPVSRMPLVEVIPGLDTAEATLEMVFDICRKIGKTPIRVKDVPGFAVNRVLHAFLIEAVRLIEEGVISPADLDTACRLGLGHPMGPFELMDATTSSLCLQAQEIMFQSYGERFRPRPLLKQRVSAGLTGGRGHPGWRRKS